MKQRELNYIKPKFMILVIKPLFIEKKSEKDEDFLSIWILFFSNFLTVMKSLMPSYLETVSSIVIVGQRIVVSLRWIGQHISLSYYWHHIITTKNHQTNRMALLWFGIQNSKSKRLKMYSIVKVLLCQPVLRNFTQTLYLEEHILVKSFYGIIAFKNVHQFNEAH